MSEIVDEWLAHYGVKGQRWGVVREKDSSEKMSRNKKLAIAGGVVLGAAAIAAGAYYLKSNPKLVNQVVKDIPKPEEPTSIIHVSRGKHNGYRPLLNGGVKSPTAQFINAAIQNGVDPNGGVVDSFVRFGERNEKIFANFKDPKGRKDFAGRTITHDVILPELKSIGLKTFDEIKDLAWSEIKDTYESFYDLPDEKLKNY